MRETCHLSPRDIAYLALLLAGPRRASEIGRLLHSDHPAATSKARGWLLRMRREGEADVNVDDDRARWRITEAGKRRLLALINDREGGAESGGSQVMTLRCTCTMVDSALKNAAEWWPSPACEMHGDQPAAVVARETYLRVAGGWPEEAALKLREAWQNAVADGDDAATREPKAWLDANGGT